MSILATHLNVRPVRAFSDNYIWLIESPAAPAQVVAVDPGEAEPVIEQLERANLKLGAILLTHHHPDHVGVTVVVPRQGDDHWLHPFPAGCARLNGSGEIAGLAQVEEWGIAETPIFLTSSMAIGRVYDGAIEALAPAFEAGFAGEPIMPVVAECDDSDLNRPLPVQVDAADVRAALDAARGSEAGTPALGVVGAGTGMRAFGLKAGIGSASRLVRPIHRWSEDPAPGAPTFTVGVLVMANFEAADLTEADLSFADLRGANLKRGSLAGASLMQGNLGPAQLANADGSDAERAWATNLEEADLEKADLTGANLKGARLTGANTTRAMLTGAVLTDTELAGRVTIRARRR